LNCVLDASSSMQKSKELFQRLDSDYDYLNPICLLCRVNAIFNINYGEVFDKHKQYVDYEIVINL